MKDAQPLCGFIFENSDVLGKDPEGANNKSEPEISNGLIVNTFTGIAIGLSVNSMGVALSAHRAVFLGETGETVTAWTVYILRCADKTLYTGITNDLPARLAKHAGGTGAKYTRGRGPFEVIYTERHRARGRALKRELAIKGLRREQKLELAFN